MKDTHWILGPGAIGRLLAHSLAPHLKVLLIGRHQQPLSQTLTSPEGVTREQALTSLTASGVALKTTPPPDYLHITTKALAAEAALESIKAAIPPATPLVLWQNGFLAQPRLADAWPGPVLCATTTEGAYLNGDHNVVHAGRGHTFVGDLENRHAGLALEIALKLSQAGLKATAVDDIRQRLWQKLAINAAINPLVALHGVRNGALHNEPYASCVVAAVKEVAAIMQAESIEPPNGQPGMDAWLTLVWQVVENTANNKASMLQDIEAKRPTERGAILGPLIKSAQHHDLKFTVLKALDTNIAALEASLMP